MKNMKNKLIVFDVDETIGAFSSFAGLCDQVSPYRTTMQLFAHLLDQNPSFLRPKILDILSFVKHNKMLGRCQVALYTNNQGPNQWVNFIKTYLESKLDYPLFDHVVRAYKVNGVHVEKKRTRHEKCLNDLLACTNCHSATKIFFVDDQVHEDMIKPSVHYFRIRPYDCPKSDVEPSQKLMQHLVQFLQS
jgi:FMN phosphatase YigB (HAD superfamily)